MSEELNWGSLYDSAGDADKPLPNGPYNVEVTKAEAKTTKNGKPMFALSAKVLDGPNAGRFLWHNITVTVENPNAMRMFFLNMAAFGIKDEFFKRVPAPTNAAVAEALGGRRATFEVGIQTSGAYAGRNEVKSIKVLSGAPTPGAPSIPNPAAVSAPSPLPAAAVEAPLPPSAPAAPAPNPVVDQAPPPAPAAPPQPGF